LFFAIEPFKFCGEVGLICSSRFPLIFPRFFSASQRRNLDGCLVPSRRVSFTHAESDNPQDFLCTNVKGQARACRIGRRVAWTLWLGLLFSYCPLLFKPSSFTFREHRQPSAPHQIVLPVFLLFFYPAFATNLLLSPQVLYAGQVSSPNRIGRELDEKRAGEFRTRSTRVNVPGRCAFDDVTFFDVWSLNTTSGTLFSIKGPADSAVQPAWRS
jgi:hypothetical protein